MQSTNEHASNHAARRLRARRNQAIRTARRIQTRRRPDMPPPFHVTFSATPPWISRLPGRSHNRSRRSPRKEIRPPSSSPSAPCSSSPPRAASRSPVTAVDFKTGNGGRDNAAMVASAGFSGDGGDQIRALATGPAVFEGLLADSGGGEGLLLARRGRRCSRRSPGSSRGSRQRETLRLSRRLRRGQRPQRWHRRDRPQFLPRRPLAHARAPVLAPAPALRGHSAGAFGRGGIGNRPPSATRSSSSWGPRPHAPTGGRGLGASGRAAAARRPRSLLCRDGTTSPSCTCGRPKRGCCSPHSGVAGCEPMPPLPKEIDCSYSDHKADPANW